MAKTSKSKFDPEAFLAKADGGVTISKYGKGQVVFSQGDPADCVFYIREGRVKIAVVSAQGREAVVAFLKAGDFIGEGCLTGRPRRVSTARAMRVSLNQAGIGCAGKAIRVECPKDGVRVTVQGGDCFDLDVLYPALGCQVRSELATGLGAACTETGNVIVDAHQRTSVAYLYAAGDIVSDLHQLAVATGHAAIATTTIHNSLGRNPR